MRVVFIFCLAFLILCGNLFAQSDVRTPDGKKKQRTLKEIKEDSFERQRQAMDILAAQKPVLSQTPPKKLTKAERKKLKEVTRVHKEDRLKYKSFLKQSKTGIFRILPDFGCETPQLVRIDGDCAQFVPGRWAYSFRRKDYGGEDFHDIVFKKDRFEVDSLLTQGILVALGDVSLENISLGSPQLKYLNDFVPKSERIEASRQYERLSAGVVRDGYSYSNKALAVKNTTYAIRIIAYRFKDEWSSRLWEKNLEKSTKDERKFQWIKLDKRNDSIFVFRVIRQEPDGIATIVWKQLSKKKAPTLVYEETEKLVDFSKR